ncbi:hypothetical protein [Streptomyces sp. NPDC048442]|uniref:ATP-dependent DNA ligase n=1 Tax=Streptomyces sp. NPDC048442 TaxID=3154823 RepID=UPI00343D8D3D
MTATGAWRSCAQGRCCSSPGVVRPSCLPSRNSQRLPLTSHLVVFDLLEADGEVLLTHPYRERWARLQELFSAGVLGPPWTLVASTEDRATVEEWLAPEWGSVGIEGIVVKPGTGRYRPGHRGGWIKVRAYDSAEGIIGGVTGPVEAPLFSGQRTRSAFRRSRNSRHRLRCRMR